MEFDEKLAKYQKVGFVLRAPNSETETNKEDTKWEELEKNLLTVRKTQNMKCFIGKEIKCLKVY
jgi:hypothetical protein